MAVFKRHEFDELRFDVTVSDAAYYLRAETEDMRETWMEALEQTKVWRPGTHAR